MTVGAIPWAAQTPAVTPSVRVWTSVAICTISNPCSTRLRASSFDVVNIPAFFPALCAVSRILWIASDKRGCSTPWARGCPSALDKSKGPMKRTSNIKNPVLKCGREITDSFYIRNSLDILICFHCLDLNNDSGIIVSLRQIIAEVGQPERINRKRTTKTPFSIRREFSLRCQLLNHSAE